MEMLSLISLISLCYVLLILTQFTYCSLNITSTLLLHIHIAAYTEVPLITSSLSNGLNTTNCNMLFPSNPMPVPLSLHISSPFMTYRTPVSQNLFDMVVPPTAKTLTHFTPPTSSLLGPITVIMWVYGLDWAGPG